MANVLVDPTAVTTLGTTLVLTTRLLTMRAVDAIMIVVVFIV